MAIPDFEDLVREVFDQTIPCLGYLDCDGLDDRFGFTQVSYPVDRTVSSRCMKYYHLMKGSEATDTELQGIGLCLMCRKLVPVKKDPPERKGQQKKRRRKVTDETTDDDLDEDFIVENEEEEEEVKPKVKREVKPKTSGQRRKRVKINGKTVFQCPDCVAKYSQECSLLSHRRLKHFYGWFTCKSCKYTGSHALEFYDHFTAEHRNYTDDPAKDVTFEAPCCNKTFEPGQRSEYESHYTQCLEEQKKEKRKKYYQGNNQSPKQKLKAHQCELCGKAFPSKVNLKDHMDDHNGIKSYACEEDGCGYATSFRSNFNNHKNSHLRKKGIFKSELGTDLMHPCDLCERTFVARDVLKKHRITVHEGGVLEYPCKVCGKVFTNRAALRRHRNLAHLNNDNLTCKLCGYVAGDNSLFATHQLSHEAAKFMCKYCGKALKSMSRLVEHERIHTGENPYKCNYCDYVCKSSTTLYHHKRIQHLVKSKRKLMEEANPSALDFRALNYN